MEKDTEKEEKEAEKDTEIRKKVLELQKKIKQFGEEEAENEKEAEIIKKAENEAQKERDIVVKKKLEDNKKKEKILYSLTAFIIYYFYKNELKNLDIKYHIIGIIISLVITKISSFNSNEIIFNIIKNFIFEYIFNAIKESIFNKQVGGSKVQTSKKMNLSILSNTILDIKKYLGELVDEITSIIIEWKKNPNIDIQLIVDKRKEISIKNESKEINIKNESKVYNINQEEIIDIKKSKYYKELKELQNKLLFKLSPKLINKAESIIRKIEENKKVLDKEYNNIIQYNNIMNGISKNNIFSGIMNGISNNNTKQKTINIDYINDIISNYSDAYKASLNNYKKLVRVENKQKQKLEYIFNL